MSPIKKQNCYFIILACSFFITILASNSILSSFISHTVQASGNTLSPEIAATVVERSTRSVASIGSSKGTLYTDQQLSESLSELKPRSKEDVNRRTTLSLILIGTGVGINSFIGMKKSDQNVFFQNNRRQLTNNLVNASEIKTIVRTERGSK